MTPLQKWICAAYVLRLWCSECCTCASCTYVWCSECCTCASCTYVQNMCKLLPYLIYAQHVCYLCTQHVLLAHMHATGMLHKCFLHVCMLQCAAYMPLTHKLLVFLICAACIHACYYSAAYMPLTHMQATSVPHMCSLHAACIHACYYSAAYMPLTHMQATSVPHMCSLHTCMLLQCCIHATYTHASY